MGQGFAISRAAHVMKVYYAHSVSLYGTQQEKRDIDTLTKLGFEVLNPNDKFHTDNYAIHGMNYFGELTKSCDLVAFRSLSDGSIGAGVAAEIDMFKSTGRPIIELPSGISRRKLTIEQTREHIIESGAR